MNPRRAIGIGLGLGLLVGLGSLATGWVRVEPGEVVVVTRLGRVLPQPWTAGPHWGWPWGLDRFERVRIDEVRRLAIGLARTPGPDDAPDAGEFLTGDLNLLRAQGVVQYRVADPVAFVLQGATVEPLLARHAEASLARTLAHRGIDAVLRDDRAAVAHAVQAELAALVARDQLGLAILGVSLTDARPPTEVQAEFAAAQSSRFERDRRIDEARTHASTTLPAAQAAAQARQNQARAQAERQVALARSRADRFLALLDEAQTARPITVRRLYLETLHTLLPQVRRKLVLTPDEPIDLSIFDTLPRSRTP